MASIEESTRRGTKRPREEDEDERNPVNEEESGSYALYGRAAPAQINAAMPGPSVDFAEIPNEFFERVFRESLEIIFEDSSDSESEAEEEGDDSISIVYEKLRRSPDLKVEYRESTNELIVDFFRGSPTPYYGHFFKKIKVGRKSFKVLLSVSIGGQQEEPEIAPVAGPSQPSAESTPKKSTITCTICMDTLDEILASGRAIWSTLCGHLFCNVCGSRTQSTCKKCPKCCRDIGDKNDFHPIYCS